MNDSTAAGDDAPAAEQEQWGNPLRGAAVSLGADKRAYRLGEPVHLTLKIRNQGNEAVRLLWGDPVATYRVLAFHETGRPVPKADRLIRAETSTEQPGAISRSVADLEPGDTRTETFDLGLMAKFSGPGDYYVIAARRLMSWEEGFLVSNALRITIAKG